MYKKLIGWTLLAIIVLAALVPTIASEPSPDELPWWNDDYFSRQEIVIHINTSNDHSHFQPIDIPVEFDESCWAKNENEHSVRVCYWNGIIWIQLESQIYDLDFIEDDLISSCNFVFLIPEEANGEENYYIYYDGEEKTSPDFPNRVDVTEDYYRYEQIPGLLFESSYYKITEGDEVVYAISKEGTAYDEALTQQVAKLKIDSEEVKPSLGEIGAAFNFIYWWKNNDKWKSISTAENPIEKQIIIDGNLMIKIGIISESNDGKLRSTVFYKYYFCPTDDKSIYTHVKHEVVDYPLPTGNDIDVGFVTFSTAKFKSSTIDELNFGQIPPYIHFYSEEERIIPFEVDQHPEGAQWQEVIGKKDDYDFGSSPWISFDEGTSGKAHAVIFDSNEILQSGYDEHDGIELQFYESNRIQFTGLNAFIATSYLMRNSFEDGEIDLVVPENYKVEFNAKFYTTENGGYPSVEEEAKLYQSLIQYQPSNNDSITDDEDVERFNFTAFVHLAPSFPLGSFLSTGYGLNVSFLTAEVYKENSFTSSGACGVSRISLCNEVPGNFEDLTFVEKIKAIIDIFDWKTLTLFKKVNFPNLEKDRYIIKIFRENLLFGNERQFIGYGIFNLDENKEIHIYCRMEGKAIFSFFDQNQNGLENVQIYLKQDNLTLARYESDSEGIAVVNAPCGLTYHYNFDIVYKGFLVKEESMRLGLMRKIIPLRKTHNFDVYNFEINIRDSDNKIPIFDADFSLTSDEMQYPIPINADSVSDGVYTFNGLYPADYDLIIKYNSFEINEKISIPDTESMSIKLYDFTAIIKDIWNLSSGAQIDVFLKSEDFEKSVVLLGEQISSDEYLFSNLYPGNYELKVRYKSFTIDKSVTIPDKQNIEIIFNAAYNLTAMIYDSHGNALENAKIVMIRDEKEEQGITNENGEIAFILPPGTYLTKIYSDGNLVAERKVDIFNKKNYKVVTTSEPLIPYLTIGLMSLAFIGVSIISYRKKNLILFLKLVVILLIIVAIVSPWWEMNGSSSDHDLETSTKFFLMPTKMATITSNNNVSAGEIASLEKDLTQIVDTVLPPIIFATIIFIFITLLLDSYNIKRLSLTVLLTAVIFYFGVIVMYLSEMSKLANSTVGSLMGNGNIEISIPGEKTFETLSCSWGPSIGFYLTLTATIILIFDLILYIKKTFFKRKKTKQ
jgi:hypothetical protein